MQLGRQKRIGGLAVDRSQHCCPKLERRTQRRRSVKKRPLLIAGNSEDFTFAQASAIPGFGQ
jgi:hypothetical protein